MAYVFKQWLAIIGPENLSVAGKDSLRTNNPSESINKSINKLLGLKKKLSPIFFTRALIQFQIKSQTRVISMLKMKNVHFEKKLSSTERVNKLQQNWVEVKNGGITVPTFFENVGQLIGQDTAVEDPKLLKPRKMKEFVFWGTINGTTNHTNYYGLNAVSEADADKLMKIADENFA
ncbi:GSCOCG00011078001-RA-CDS, partial [Cotesia congregata]